MKSFVQARRIVMAFGGGLLTLVCHADSRFPENVVEGDLHISSSPEGTLDYDTTGRLLVESYQKSNPSGRFGEGIHMLLKDPDAKNMISWYEDWNGQKRLVGWIGAHHGANDSTQPPHDHLSIEVPDSHGWMQTRLEIPYGWDRTVIKTSSADFAVQDGRLRIGGKNNREIVFAKETDVNANFYGTRRWAIRVQAEPNNDLQIVRYDANGQNPQSVIRINQASGEISAYDDIKFKTTLQSNVGPILQDRATKQWMRLYVENGVLKTEAVN